MKLGVIFGSSSTEHEVSVVSGYNVINNLDKKKYEVIPIYLDKNNNWYTCENFQIEKFGELPKKTKPVKNVFEFLKKLDCVFPVMHGKMGEDGSIQGFLEVLGIPYVGCNILASSVCMNKIYTKAILKKVSDVSPDITIIKENKDLYYYDDLKLVKKVNIKDIDKLINEKLNYPVFIKPSRFGSSVGVTKVKNGKSLKKALFEALKYDSEVLIEKEIKGRELECAVLCGKSLEVGEVLSAEEFYDYDAKYQNEESKTVIPANIPKEIKNNIKDIAQLSFRATNCKGLARVDFFLENKTNKIIINEINTMPGFTDISMYPKLAEAAGISYKKLLDILIKDALKNK